MSLWPEHPVECAPYKEQTKEALLALSNGPPDDEPEKYTICVGCEVFIFDAARWLHFPNDDSPTHLLVWTQSSAHIFHYHDIECALVGMSG